MSKNILTANSTVPSVPAISAFNQRNMIYQWIGNHHYRINRMVLHT